MSVTASGGGLAKACEARENECLKEENAHQRVANSWNRTNYVLGIVAALLGVLVGGAAVDVTAIGPLNTALGKAIFSLIAGLLAAVLSFLKPAAMMEKHKQSKDDLTAVREKFNAFRVGALAQAQQPYSQALLDEYQKLLDEKTAAEKEGPLVPARMLR